MRVFDDGYVGELFPFVVEANHGSEDYVPDPNWRGGILCHECAHDHGVCQDREAGICRHYRFVVPCLRSECNLWRWFNFEVLQGIHNWVMT